MNLKYLQNKGEGVYELMLHGIVGEEIDGRQVASEILSLNQLGATVIKERINTIGGSVIHAFSIVSANLASECEIHTFNEGVADSAGSFILASGDPGKRGAFDFSTMMIHNPSVDGVSLDEMEESPLKGELSMMRDSIVTILSNNSGKTVKEVREMMTNNTRMNSKQAKEFGFIDFVEKSVKKPAITENMSLAEVMNICKDFNNEPEDKQLTLQLDNTNNTNKMKDVLKYLNLSEDANENAALIAIKNMEKQALDAGIKAEDLETQITEKDTKITELENSNQELKDQVSEFENKAITSAVQSAIDSGKYSEEDKEKLTNKAKKLGIEDFNEMVGMAIMPKGDALGKIVNDSSAGNKQPKDEKLAKEYDDLTKNNPEKLERMMNQEPTKFNELLDAWNKSNN